MRFAIIIAIIILILFLLSLAIYSQIYNIQTYNIKINEAMKSINLLQELEIEFLTKISKIINKNNDQKILKDLPKIKNKQLNEFETENVLYNMKKEIKDFFEYNNLKNEEQIKDLINMYKKTIIEKKALKLYYNSNSSLYNEYIKKIKCFPIKIIKKLKLKDIFNIQKEIEFEILKKKDNS